MVRGIGNFYSQGQPGELMAILGSWNLLEVSLNRGRASEHLGCRDPAELRLELKLE